MSLEVDIVQSFPDGGFCGRQKIYTNARVIDASNVANVVSKALATHQINKSQIQYLWNYYKGCQDIRLKTKEVRTAINNKVMVNRANEIVTFKTAYLLGEPIQYVSASGDEAVSKQIARLNDFARAEDKESKDKELADWLHIAGVCPRMVLPDDMAEKDGSPFALYSLTPMEAFVIYYSGLGKKPLAGVLIQQNEKGEEYQCVYTENQYFEVQGDKILLSKPHALGNVPIVEYENNTARMGAFEVVLPLLNAINTLESNRVDNVQDFVNAFDVFQNCEIDQESYSKLSEGGKAICIKTTVPGQESKVYRIYSTLDQSGAQTQVDDLYDGVLTICGMPNRNGGSSTSDTGKASMLRDGWSSAESRAKDSEKLWKRSERNILRIVLKICNATAGMDLEISQIQTEFTRTTLTDIQSNAQVLCELLANDMVDPKDAYQVAKNLFPDVEAAYLRGMKWYEQQQQDLERQLTNERVGTGGSSNPTTDEEGNQAV